MVNSKTEEPRSNKKVATLHFYINPPIPLSSKILVPPSPQVTQFFFRGGGGSDHGLFQVEIFVKEVKLHIHLLPFSMKFLCSYQSKD